MSRKHYNAITRALAQRLNQSALHPALTDAQRTAAAAAVEAVALDLADLFATENPRFDRDRFLAACGILD